ncbi:MAG: amino acid ABC transporter ATP-binding protein [bacterium]
MIKLKKVNKTFQDKLILNNVDLEIAKGTIVSIIGPSGAGKTTLLRCIKQLERIDQGLIVINDFDVTGQGGQLERAQILMKIGYVFQEFNLFPNKTIWENLELPLRLVSKTAKAEREFIITKQLEEFGILAKKNDYPSQLSGGQKQRVAIARALVMKPEVMLFDEPTSALDQDLKKQVLDLIRQLSETKNLTTIIVTHELQFAREISDAIVYLDKGTIIDQGSAKEVIG